MTPILLVKTAYLGFHNVGQCYDHVMNNAHAYFLAKDFPAQVEKLNMAILDELGEKWETHTVHEAAEMLGFDLNDYIKSVDKQIADEQIGYT